VVPEKQKDTGSLMKTEFHHAGHFLKQIWRQNDVAVFSRSRSPDREPHELELIIVRTRIDRTMPNGKFVPAHEAYPNPSEWGTWAWSFPIRYINWVLNLAVDVHRISKVRPSFVREAIQRKGRYLQGNGLPLNLQHFSKHEPLKPARG
jgi:hypothetical protein